MKFHRRCGDRVTLLNENSTAVRNFVEFNHGLILSAEPLKDDTLFEVCIDRKVNVWNGSLEIGVTTLDPEFVELPATATKLRNTAWIMSGSSIVKDGITLVNSFGPELDSLQEGDCVGVMRTSKGELMFYVNSQCLGIAAIDIPPRVFAVIDLYGQCVQVSITCTSELRPIMMNSLEQIEEDTHNEDPGTSSEMEVAGLPPESYPEDIPDVYIPMTSEGACALVTPDRLRFHPRCGILVKLSSSNKCAERARPLDDYNNGVVMTHRPLYNNELFEIRIERLVDKWSGSIEVGVTSHDPSTIRFPSTMTNMESGTVMMSGCKVLINGHGTCREYGNFNLDELREGDTVGMMKKSDGKLHYYINGVDQGVATDKVDSLVWGVVDLYGMTVKVSIVDPCEDMEGNPLVVDTIDSPSTSRCRPRIDEDSLLFHSLRDSNVVIINDGKTAHRPNAFKYFNNGIVMTNRTLKTNELFQVRLDLVVPKWAGSIEIGVTQLSFHDIQFPFKMSNAKFGTWAVTGEDVMRDGTILIPQYIRNLNKLVEGDTVGVMRTENGILHFFINGIDQGPAAFNVPDFIYGIIDLYGRAAQVTIMSTYITPPAPPLYSPDSPMSSDSNATIFPEMCFHRVHGRNARLNRNRLIASRATVYSEFNDAVLFSSRPLRECDMFEVRIDKMVDCWIGSLEIGVTAIRPEDLEGSGGVGTIAGTATDLCWDTYILSGAAMMKDGECVRSGYPLDLDTLTVGSRVGMMWHADRSLHYYLDGIDMGRAWFVPHLNIYAVIDLYGQCTQVTILQNEERTFNYNACTNSDNSMLSNSRAMSSPPPPYWSFSEYCGDNICLMHDYSIAKRSTPDPTSNLVFSSSHLAVEEIYEIQIAECRSGYAGTFRIGITDINILNAYVNRSLPPSISCLPHYTAYIDGGYVFNTQIDTDEQDIETFTPSFEWLRPGDRIGLKRTSNCRVLIYYNNEELDFAFENVPDKVYVVMELFGNVNKIQALNQGAIIVTNGMLLRNAIPNGAYRKSNVNQPNNIYTENIDGLFEANLTNLCVMSGESADGSMDGFGMVPAMEPSAAMDRCENSDERPLEGSATNSPSQSPALSPAPDAMVPPVLVTPSAPTATPPEASDEEAPQPANPPADLPGVLNNGEGNDAAVPAAAENVELAPEIRRRRNNLPYTFSYVGDNIKLCSSDTVAVRFKGYHKGVAVVGHPLRRGHHFRFRVDRMDRQWCGTAAVGAVGMLPVDMPISAIHMEPPCWLLTNDLIHDNGLLTMSLMGMALERLTEQSVLTLHFRFNSELILEIDGRIIGTIAVIPRKYSHVFPTIDLYGPISQVSVLLHPYVMGNGASLDLPIIAENLWEDDLAEQEYVQNGDHEHEAGNEEGAAAPEADRPQKKPKAFSQENLLDEYSVPIVVKAGPSTRPDTVLEINTTTTFDNKNTDVNSRKNCMPCRMSLHHSLILSNDVFPARNTETGNKPIQKSHSTHSFSQALEVNDNNGLRHTISVGSRVGNESNSTIHEQFFDTNIRHNDRYPEAGDVDNIDSELMDGLTVEPGNLPDLAEEQSPSIDESTRRDEFWTDNLPIENLNYLNHILCLDQDAAEGQNLESEWEASGVGCEHLHLVLKFWNYLVLPFPELGRTVSWDQVKCYCSNCEPDAAPALAGWVRIERMDSAGAPPRSFWHVVRSSVEWGQDTEGDFMGIRRPRCFINEPFISQEIAEIWLDEEGKPHDTILALEIEVDEFDDENDRLVAFLIHLKPHVAEEEHPPTFDE